MWEKWRERIEERESEIRENRGKRKWEKRIEERERESKI